MHGFLSRDQMPPAEFLGQCRRELALYPTVTLAGAEVVSAVRIEQGFEAALASGQTILAKKILIATGLVDELPEIPGLREKWGRSVFPCPFCDGWEFRDQPMALLCCGALLCDFAFELLTWTKKLHFLTHGSKGPSDDAVQRLERMHISIRTEPVTSLEGPAGKLRYIRFADGAAIECRALFLATSQRQRSELASQLGCAPLTPDRTVPTDDLQHTRSRGVFVAGNAAEGLQVAILAAAEGFKAAYAINDELIQDILLQADVPASAEP